MTRKMLSLVVIIILCAAVFSRCSVAASSSSNLRPPPSFEEIQQSCSNVDGVQALSSCLENMEKARPIRNAKDRRRFLSSDFVKNSSRELLKGYNILRCSTSMKYLDKDYSTIKRKLGVEPGFKITRCDEVLALQRELYGFDFEIEKCDSKYYRYELAVDCLNAFKRFLSSTKNAGGMKRFLAAFHEEVSEAVDGYVKALGSWEKRFYQAFAVNIDKCTRQETGVFDVSVHVTRFANFWGDYFELGSNKGMKISCEDVSRMAAQLQVVQPDVLDRLANKDDLLATKAFKTLKKEADRGDVVAAWSIVEYLDNMNVQDNPTFTQPYRRKPDDWDVLSFYAAKAYVLLVGGQEGLDRVKAMRLRRFVEGAQSGLLYSYSGMEFYISFVRSQDDRQSVTYEDFVDYERRLEPQAFRLIDAIHRDLMAGECADRRLFDNHIWAAQGDPFKFNLQSIRRLYGYCVYSYLGQDSFYLDIGEVKVRSCDKKGASAYRCRIMYGLRCEGNGAVAELCPIFERPVARLSLTVERDEEESVYRATDIIYEDIR